MLAQSFYFEFVDINGRTIEGQFERCPNSRAKDRALQLLNHHRHAMRVIGYREQGLSVVTATRYIAA